MKTLVIRFGSIGDLFSAYAFCRSRNGYDLFCCRSVKAFFGLESDPVGSAVALLPNTSIVKILGGNLFSLIRVINSSDYKRVVFFCQSDRGVSYKLARYALAILKKFKIVPYRLVLQSLFHGGQYYWQLNDMSVVKEILSSMSRSPVVSIFYDGKEPSKNLSCDSVFEICKVLTKKFENPKIKLYGQRRLNLPFHDHCLTNFTGITEMSQIVDIVASTDLAIVADSGPMHILALENTPCIVFMGGRLPLLNWAPLKKSNYYIFDDELECLGCMKHSCPKGDNVCVNSNKTLHVFKELFDSVGG